jgi:GNAT superfamily N-acetyltransferase
MTTADLRLAAEQHRDFLADGFFVALGPGFLKTYLATFLDSCVSIALVAEQGDATVGFLVGSFDHRAHVQMTVRRHGVRLAARGLVALLVRPRVATRFLRTRARRYVTGLARAARRRRQSGSVTPVAGGLGHVAVVPEARNLGIGAALVAEYVRRVQTYGVGLAQLTTRSGSDGAGQFYERLGWTRSISFTDPDGASWTRYLLEL